MAREVYLVGESRRDAAENGSIHDNYEDAVAALWGDDSKVYVTTPIIDINDLLEVEEDD